MKTTRVLIVAVLITLFVAGSIGPASAEGEEMVVPLGSFSINPPSEGQRSAVQFPHSLHFDYACKQCHHKWKGDEPIVGCMTQGCHDLAQLPKKEAAEKADPSLKARYFKNAFHKQCIGCHRKIKLENKKLEMTKAGLEGRLPAPGPTGCNGCHLPE